MKPKRKPETPIDLQLFADTDPATEKAKKTEEEEPPKWAKAFLSSLKLRMIPPEEEAKTKPQEIALPPAKPAPAPKRKRKTLLDLIS